LPVDRLRNRIHKGSRACNGAGSFSLEGGSMSAEFAIMLSALILASGWATYRLGVQAERERWLARSEKWKKRLAKLDLLEDDDVY
jgi:hypothetical protein